MQLKSLLILLCTATAAFAAEQNSNALSASLQAKIGFDTNPVGARAEAAAILGDRDCFTSAVGLQVGYSVAGLPSVDSLKFTYAADDFAFDGWSSENYTTHRLGLVGQASPGEWRLSADASTLYVDGNDETLQSVSSTNANGTSLWRERRAQWQHRVKLVGQRPVGKLLIRGTANYLGYDYQTKVVAGHVAFADRSDAIVGADIGWPQNPKSLWLLGVRAGHQSQDTVPLPNCNYDYTNNYTRLALGWEGKLSDSTSLTFSAGPDFKHYTGSVDNKVFTDRDHTALWFDGSLTSKVSKSVTVTAKATRTTWLSSTGKSAYIDSCVDAGLSWTVTPAWTARVTGKVHQCDYYPVVRDDREALVGVGVTHKVSKSLTVSADLLRHEAWNALPEFSGREFHRFVASVGASLAL